MNSIHGLPTELPPAGPREARCVCRSGAASVHHGPDLPQWNIQFFLYFIRALQ